MFKNFTFPLNNEKDNIEAFQVGDQLNLQGTIYTARDKAHAFISSGNLSWPFALESNAIFYCGPTKPLKGYPLGSCGPTTSARMDRYTVELYDRGLAATIGKGPRHPDVIEAILRNRSLYLLAYGGCGALYGKCIKETEIIAFEEFGPQAIRKLQIVDFPVIVAVDCRGNSIFNKEEGKNE